MRIQPPENQKDLLNRANEIKGSTLNQIANQLNLDIPVTTTQAKGWAGKIIELILGADALNAPRPDFVDLGIELKTIPVNEYGKPKESTYICVVQLEPKALNSWEDSLVKTKLTKVLWVPIEGNKQSSLGARRIGNPVLWSPSYEQENQLKQDWQELTDMVVMGDIDQISSSMGTYLQIRPKAANASALTKDKNQYGNKNLTLPRGFYLRPSFTIQIISANK